MYTPFSRHGAFNQYRNIAIKYVAPSSSILRHHRRCRRRRYAAVCMKFSCNPKCNGPNSAVADIYRMSKSADTIASISAYRCHSFFHRFYQDNLQRVCANSDITRSDRSGRSKDVESHSNMSYVFIVIHNVMIRCTAIVTFFFFNTATVTLYPRVDISN